MSLIFSQLSHKTNWARASIRGQVSSQMLLTSRANTTCLSRLLSRNTGTTASIYWNSFRRRIDDWFVGTKVSIYLWTSEFVTREIHDHLESEIERVNATYVDGGTVGVRLTLACPSQHVGLIALQRGDIRIGCVEPQRGTRTADLTCSMFVHIV